MQHKKEKEKGVDKDTERVDALLEEMPSDLSFDGAIAEMLTEAIKIGGDHYLDFCKLLINDYSHWVQEAEKKQTKQCDKDNKEIVLRGYYKALVAAARAEVFLRISDYLEKNKRPFADLNDYYVRISTEILSKQGAKQYGITLFRERMQRAINSRMKASWEKLGESVYRQKLSKYLEKLLVEFEDEMKLYWPKPSYRDFKRLGIALTDETPTGLQKVKAYCESKARKWQSMHNSCLKLYTALIMEFEAGTIEEQCKKEFKRYKEKLARRIWKSRDKCIPSKYREMADTFEKFIEKIDEKYIDADFVEKETGNNLALMAKKYGNRELYLFIRHQCGLEIEELYHPNNRGLSLKDYQELGCANEELAQMAQEKIEAVEPLFQHFDLLEQRVRHYADNWQEEAQKRKKYPKSWNPLHQLGSLCISIGDGWGEKCPFEEREHQAQNMLMLIEEYRYEKEKLPEFIMRFNTLHNSIKDGLLGVLRPGRLKGAMGSSLTFFNQSSYVSIPFTKSPPISSRNESNNGDNVVINASALEPLNNENKKLKN